MKTPEGVRRLSLIVGGVLVVSWTIVVAKETFRYGWEQEYAWFWLMGAGVGWFGGILAVRGIARLGIWTVKGFRK